MGLVSSVVFKKILFNGMTILVRPVDVIPKVSVQLWYNVGSKDEQSGEKGLAHLIEHMIFKGTNTLSESDINAITHKLSGYSNAFTSYDYAAYVFDFPTHHWKESLPILADCMRNCRFDEQMLHSELMAVIQELKMYNDDYLNILIQNMLASMFPDHPYHYPIIGFKQDLWNVKRDTLFNFYRHHYVPNNATLVVVGDVDVDEVFMLAEKEFGNIPESVLYKKKEYYHSKSLFSSSITIYRDVLQPEIVFGFIIPGAKEKQGYLFDIIAWILARGRNSRLYTKLIDEQQCAVDVGAFVYDLFDSSVFFMPIYPKTKKDIGTIVSVVKQELVDIVEQGILPSELQRAEKQMKMAYASMFESNGKQATAIGESYVTTGDPELPYTYLNYPKDTLTEDIKNAVHTYMRPSIMHTGQVLAVDTQDKDQLIALQKLSDEEDSRILEGRVRNSPVEPPKRVHDIAVKKEKLFTFCKPKKYILDNGLTLLALSNPYAKKVDIVLSLRSRSHHDPDQKQGLYNFVCQMLLEGSKNFQGTKLVQELETEGMSLIVQPGVLILSVLPDDIDKGFSYLHELLTQVVFDEKAVEKVRAKIFADIAYFWDSPRDIAGQLVRELIYQKHPYSKNPLGSKESVAGITRDDLISFYKKFFVPSNAICAVVGHIEAESIKTLVEKHLGLWRGELFYDTDYSPILQVEPRTVYHTMNRDQVILVFAGRSIARTDADFDALILFEQILSGGESISMQSRLFQLREQTGLFYAISGLLADHADEQPGIVTIKTIVSVDTLQTAKNVIIKTIETVVDSLTEEELEQAKHAILNKLVENFSSNRHMASAFIFLERFNFPYTFFDTRAKQLEKITLDHVKKAARKVLDLNKMITICVGRVDGASKASRV